MRRSFGVRGAVPSFAQLLLLGLIVTTPAVAQNPNWPDGIDDDADPTDRANMPGDPSFYNERYDGETLVEVGGAWNQWSFIPELWQNTGDPIRPEEIELGAGMHADRAWWLSAGRRDVLIAVLDSGAYWDNRDLLNKFYLNRGELDRDGARPCVPAEFDGDALDVNGDGLFNMADYAEYADECDFDLDLDDNGLIDPGDLIENPRFSDGVDDDGNGYIDDISGWDFLFNDNNAYDDTRAGHGNGEASGSSAEGNNGIGGLGICPECTVMLVRAGDNFVGDVNDWADGVVFAVDSGATVIQSAMGTINHTEHSRAAIEYAYENNIAVVASAADELSFHHNFPSTNNHTIYVHAVVHDSPNRARSTTFLNFNNCTNYGGQLLLSTPGGGCSSEATEVTAGHVGLIYSYARELGYELPLSAEEVRGILLMSVDDINVAESQPGHPDYDGTKYPSGPGWDWHFGYGRNNARRSLELLRDEAIPPEVDIVNPLWFETAYVSDEVTSLDVVGRVGSRIDGLEPRYDSYDWVLDVAPGVQPAPGDFYEVSSGTTTEGIDGVLGTVDLTEFDSQGAPTDPHEFAATLRLRACVTGSGDFGGGGICSEFRKTFFVHQDPDLHDGFPIYMGTSIESSPIFIDLDGEGGEELIVAASNGWIHAFHSDGTEVEGWPVPLDPRRGHRDDFPNDHRDSCAYRGDTEREDCTTRGSMEYGVLQTVLLGSPAAANLEGDEDGDIEIVVASQDGFVYAFDHDGNRLDGFPVGTNPAFSAETDRDNTLDEGIVAQPSLYDLDLDGDLEIIVGASDQHVYVWHHDGTPMSGWPVLCRDLARDEDPDLSDSLGDRIIQTPAVGDLDNDGLPEVIVGTNEVYDTVESRFYIIHWDGNDHEGGPFENLGDDGEAGPGRNFSLLGEVLPVVGRGIPTSPVLADINFDGFIEFAVEGIGGQPVMRQWDGEEVTELRYMNISTAAFGESSDVDDDFSYTLVNYGAFGYLDDSGDLAYVKGAAGIDFGLAFAEGGVREEFDHQLAGWNTRTGLPVEGFPRVMEDWQFFVSPTIVDLNDDGYPEVVNGSGGYLLRAFNYRGDELEGWPKHTGGWIVASAGVGDFDDDGNYDVAVGTRNGWLFVWRTSGSTEGFLEWSGYGHDNQNTFNYETPIPGRNRQEPEPTDDGAERAEETPDAGNPDADAGGEDLGTPDTDAGGETDTGADGGGDTGSGAEVGDEPGDEGCCAVAAGRDGTSGRGERVIGLLLLGLALLGRRRR
jgi:hypothetical protein